MIDQLEDEDINNILKKISISNSRSKKLLFNKDYVNRIKKMIAEMPNDSIKELISKKAEQIKQINITEEQKEKLECELAILIANLPINYEQNKQYWRILEENARKNKK